MSVAESSLAASRALDDLYRKHVSEVYRYAYAVLGNHADAEDVTQTTFVNALRALERGERPRKPSNWLITIAHNIVRQRFRQQQARPTEVVLDRDIAAEPADDSGPSLEELVRALQRIPASQREALVMRELEGRSYSEIADILDLSKGALETILFRARRSLADELENLVTCDKAELSLSRQLDRRISRKERKRLDDHIAECPSCARVQVAQGKQRRAFKGLALLPLPLSLTFFKGAPSASAALGVPTIGGVGTAAAVGGAASGGGGLTLGGLALGGVGAKVAAVVAAVSVAGGVGYVGTKEVQSLRKPAAGVPAAAVNPPKAKKRAGAGTNRASATGTLNGKALAKGSARATSPTGASRGETALGRSTNNGREKAATKLPAAKAAGGAKAQPRKATPTKPAPRTAKVTTTTPRVRPTSLPTAKANATETTKSSTKASTDPAAKAADPAPANAADSRPTPETAGSNQGKDKSP